MLNKSIYIKQKRTHKRAKACRKTRAWEFCLWAEGFLRLEVFTCVLFLMVFMRSLRLVLVTFGSSQNGVAFLSAYKNKSTHEKQQPFPRSRLSLGSGTMLSFCTTYLQQSLQTISPNSYNLFLTTFLVHCVITLFIQPKSMKKLLCFLMLVCCMMVAKAQKSYDITGIITDEKNVPLPGATVFLANTQKVTIADGQGRFLLTKVKPGNYNLVARMIGYLAYAHQFRLQNQEGRFHMMLQQDNVMLQAANVSGMSRAERKEHVETFTRCFIGTSDNARESKILNADILKLNYNQTTKVLTATTDDFLIIENRLLGYRIKYLLSAFNYDRNGDGIISFAGKFFFEDLPGDARQQRKWEEARVDVYLGSITHFFRSLFNDELKQNGFVVYQMLTQQARDTYYRKDKLVPPNYTIPYTSLSRFITGVDDDTKKFDLDLLKKDSTELYIVYKPKPEARDFAERGAMTYRFFKMERGQLSLLRPVQDRVYISRNGDVSPANAMVKGGFWTWEQMSGFIPADYTLPAWVQLDKDGKLMNNN
jgi:hypothetical protein